MGIWGHQERKSEIIFSHYMPKKRGMQGDSSIENFTDSDLTKSPGRQRTESPAKRVQKHNISAGAE